MTLEGTIGNFRTGNYRIDRSVPGVVVLGKYTKTTPLDVAISAIHPTPTNSLSITAHGLVDGYGPVWLSTDGLMPLGVFSLTPYWVIAEDADHVQLASSRAAALAHSPLVDIGDAGSGTFRLATFFTAEASLQDVDGRDLEDLPEARRGQEVRVMYCVTEIKAETPGYHADVVTIEGERWRVTKVGRARVLGQYFRAYLERLEVP